MSSEYVDLRIVFNKTVERFDYGGSFEYSSDLEPVLIKHVGSSLSKDELDQIAESAFQSDRYTVEVSNGVLQALGGGEISIQH